MAEFRPALTPEGTTGLEAEIFLYDTLPGGAGFSAQVAESPVDLFQAALNLLTNCQEGCDASCYRCLRSFKNKFEHSLLDRHVGAQLLQYLINGQLTEFSKSRLASSTALLRSDLQRQSVDGTQFDMDASLQTDGEDRDGANPRDDRRRSTIHHSPLSPLDAQSCGRPVNRRPQLNRWSPDHHRERTRRARKPTRRDTTHHDGTAVSSLHMSPFTDRTEIDLLWWVPSHCEEEESDVEKPIRRTRRSTGAKWSSWFERVSRPGELAREFECSAQTVRNSVRQADRDDGRRKDGLTTAERGELRRLRREVRQLREEREILANATALVRSGDRLGTGEAFELVRANQAHHREAPRSSSLCGCILDGLVVGFDQTWCLP